MNEKRVSSRLILTILAILAEYVNLTRPARPACNVQREMSSTDPRASNSFRPLSSGSFSPFLGSARLVVPARPSFPAPTSPAPHLRFQHRRLPFTPS